MAPSRAGARSSRASCSSADRRYDGRTVAPPSTHMSVTAGPSAPASNVLEESRRQLLPAERRLEEPEDPAPDAREELPELVRDPVGPERLVGEPPRTPRERDRVRDRLVLGGLEEDPPRDGVDGARVREAAQVGREVVPPRLRGVEVVPVREEHGPLAERDLVVRVRDRHARRDAPLLEEAGEEGLRPRPAMPSQRRRHRAQRVAPREHVVADDLRREHVPDLVSWLPGT